MIDSRKRGNSFIKKHFLADSTLSRAFLSVQQTSNMSMECNYNYRFKHRTQSLLLHLDCLSFERLKEKNLYLISQEVIYAGLYIRSKYVGRPKFNVAPVAVLLLPSFNCRCNRSSCHLPVNDKITTVCRKSQKKLLD